MRIQRVLIANRGEIAVRIIRACQALGVETVLAVSEADRESLPARLADRAVCIGPPIPARSYLNIQALVSAALGTHCDALHPGYGFLAESPDLAEACVAQGITFVGPKPDQIRRMGNKLQARKLAADSGVPVLEGSQKVHSPEEAASLAAQIGLPVLLKAAAGGGGRGMKVVSELHQLRRVFTAASAEARSSFGDDTLYVERYLPNARHVEVQVLGDAFGNLIHLGERDCSLQRRHQKLVEESPAPRVTSEVREAIRRAGASFACQLNYENAGTVEFILDQDSGNFYFLEMNTRIQVEHPVTEMITGIDLVQEQLRVASGEPLRFTQAEVQFRGHAIECRITAESPDMDFLPRPGRIESWSPPEGPNIRVDTHCYCGYEVPAFYDSLLAKLIVYGSTRAEAVARMHFALRQFKVEGVETILPFLRVAVDSPEFVSGDVSTHLVEALAAQARG